MRGKHHLSGIMCGSSGITPAGAGKTNVSVFFGGILQDHPRRCGENKIITFEQLNSAGSPPQVRGKRTVKLGLLQSARITPAGAGKTRMRILFECGRKDHPRRCGENQHQRRD